MRSGNNSPGTILVTPVAKMSEFFLGGILLILYVII
jgi:hypothetical protein